MLESLELLASWRKLFLMKMYDENMEIHMLHSEHDLMNAMRGINQNLMIRNLKNQFD
jgi:hypothetical protein